MSSQPDRTLDGEAEVVEHGGGRSMQAVRVRDEVEHGSRSAREPTQAITRLWPSTFVGATASATMMLFYVIVVLVASRSVDHVADQVAADWYLLLLIVAGFGVQVGLLVELRRRHRVHGNVVAASAAGAGASTMGMVACCAHHLADFLPLVGATAAATFLYDYRLPFMLVGVGLNAIAISLAIGRLQKISADHEEVEHACALAGSSR